MKQKTCFIYVLELQEQRHYIGYSTNYIKRINEHNDQISKKGSVYVKKFLPITVHKIVKIYADMWQAQLYENIITLYYACIFDIKKVRGGNFTLSNDFENEKKIIKALKKQKISLNNIEYTTNRIDIVRDFNNQNCVYKNNFNLGTEVSEQQKL